MKTKYNIGDTLHTIDNNCVPPKYITFKVSAIKAHKIDNEVVIFYVKDDRWSNDSFAEFKCAESKAELLSKIKYFVDELVDIVKKGIKKGKKK